MKYALPAGAFPKRCTVCGASYDAAAWLALPFVGVQMTYADDGVTIVPSCELRNCPCRTTLGVEVSAP